MRPHSGCRVRRTVGVIALLQGEIPLCPSLHSSHHTQRSCTGFQQQTGCHQAPHPSHSHPAPPE